MCLHISVLFIFICRRWFGICEEAVHALFHVHPCPDEVIGSLVATLYLELSELQSPRQIAHLSRLIFFLGQASLGTLVYTERIAGIAKKSKEAATLKAKDTAASAVTASAPTVARTGTAGKTRLSTSSEKGGHEEEDAMEMEMGLAASADAIHEMTCNNVIETQLVLNNILGKFHPLIAYVVANENGTFSNPLLRETALLALCRFMSVSVALCERYLPVLFTALEKETQPHVRTSIMIGLGDLAFRFPNALEPWTAHLYSRLSDDSVMVRYNTLTVLTHLILNDMVKVKGQVSHVVACLTDEHDRIRDLAATFFTKLSERSNNPVYNLLGDIIATLSNDKPSVNASGHKDTNADVDNDEDITTNIPAVESDTPVLVAALDQSSLPAKYLTKAEFQKTMQFMLGFVKKDMYVNIHIFTTWYYTSLIQY